jgi:formylglycine-generating enzyme required for sulfatase activity
MIRIPAGEFIMGTSYEDAVAFEREMRASTKYAHFFGDVFYDEMPQRTVYLDAFSIDQVEVTVARYRRCVEAGICSPLDASHADDGETVRRACSGRTPMPTAGGSASDCRWSVNGKKQRGARTGESGPGETSGT